MRLSVFKILIWASVVLFHSFSGIGQHYYQIHLDESKGLSSNEVFNVFQDRTGFMWIATNNGVCRYDGNRFQQFIHPGQSSLAGSALAEDLTGNI